MAPRQTTNTIPGSVSNNRRWQRIVAHKNKADELSVAMDLFYFLDRESIAITQENTNRWEELKFENQYLLTNEDYLLAYGRMILFKEMIPNLLEIARTLVNPAMMGAKNIELLDLRVTSEDRFIENLKRFYPYPYRDRLSECFPATSDMIYKPVIEDPAFVLSAPISDIAMTYDLPNLIFQLFDDNPYCHFTRQNQKALGISDWKSRREPSKYSLRILGFIVSNWKEFLIKEPTSTQDLIAIILMIMFNLMRRLDYYGTRELLTTSPEHYMHTIIDRNLDEIADVNKVYNCYRVGAGYIKNRPSGDGVVERYGVLNTF